MFGKEITLFKLFGFEVKVDLSWIIIVFLITWTLARGVFPDYYRGYTLTTYWIMGVMGALGLFTSIVAHEFSHSMVARRMGLSIRGITLFIFGGVAKMEEEPANPRTEFFMSIAGPLASVVVAFIFWGLTLAGRAGEWPRAVTGVLSYLRSINFILAGFNILPAFPLDGGRLLRSGLWKWKGNLRWATRVASLIGSGFGIALIMIGFFFIFTGHFIGGMWWVLIGLFLWSASKSSYQKLLMTELLKGEPVRRFMKTEIITVPSEISLENLIEDYVYRYHYKMFPVVDGGKLRGCVTVRGIKEIPREEWNHHMVREVVEPCSNENTIDQNEDATRALSRMHRTKNSRLMVVEGNRLIGVITLKDLLHFLSLKMDLEEEQILRQ